MDGYASFPHAIGMRHHHKMAMLQAAMGERVATYGMVCILLEVLYECGGSIDLPGGGREYLASELDCDKSGLDAFLGLCAKIGWIDAGPLKDGVVTSHNVMEQIAYKDAKSAAGKANGRKRAGNAKSTSKSTCFNT